VLTLKTGSLLSIGTNLLLVWSAGDIAGSYTASDAIFKVRGYGSSSASFTVGGNGGLLPPPLLGGGDGGSTDGLLHSQLLTQLPSDQDPPPWRGGGGLPPFYGMYADPHAQLGIIPSFDVPLGTDHSFMLLFGASIGSVAVNGTLGGSFNAGGSITALQAGGDITASVNTAWVSSEFAHDPDLTGSPSSSPSSAWVGDVLQVNAAVHADEQDAVAGVTQSVGDFKSQVSSNRTQFEQAASNARR